MTTKNNDWENWLTPEMGEYLLKIKAAVTALDKQDSAKEPLAYYTPHGPKHFKMVEDNLHKLIPDKDAINCFEEEERFYLLASAWLHDIGMYRSVAKEVWGKELDDNEIREYHHITSAKFIVNNYERCNLKEQDKEFLATLCLYHRRKENIDKCPTEKSVGVGNKRFKIRLIAAYLRLADALDIGTYRTPTPAYAICLAYNIPQESKMHWIKNRIINGIFINASSHTISVEFMEPKLDQQSGSYAKEIINKKLGYVIDSVMQDLNEELNSVKQILISNKATYFLYIESTRNIEFVPEQTTTDLIEMVANYDILVHPSASKLLEMILQTIANISGYHLQKNVGAIKITSEKKPNVSKIKKDLSEFLDIISRELIKSRPCHYGLIKLVNECAHYYKEYLEVDNLTGFGNNVTKLFLDHHRYRHKIRTNASEFFKNNSNDKTHQKETNKQIVIVLYGYSELTIKAICGFRDSILQELYPDTKRKDFYNHNIESDISERFIFFICEGQPKTITAPQDKLVYHDGIRYASALENRKFTNIVMIPDAAVGTILNNYNVDYILVGANGFDKSSFIHSAGHASIINLALHNKIVKRCNKPYIVLSTTKEKFKPSADQKRVDCVTNSTGPELSDSGVNFYRSHLSGRERLWFIRDPQAINQFCGENISIFNPREDIIPIKDLDFVISDSGWFPIKGGNIEVDNISEKIRIFTDAQQIIN
ncbi:MAG: HD domain-containing protein [Thermodesulfobacteriota bacterium]|jgi:methylthioribose-1-phosphate isomerase|nr:HD domain-containing protein [Thermodesulfobacteriota bacterium]